jgi:rhodanese-related sulfurtransferase
VLLDVRTSAEFAAGHIPGTVNVPIDTLRDRMPSLDRAKPIIAYCQVGQRGYLATRILSQVGFDAANLSGGYETFRQYGVP